MKHAFASGLLRLLGLTTVLTVSARGDEHWNLTLANAHKGDLQAQLHVAYAFAKGERTGRSMDDAIHWYRLAAAQGDASACFNLGMLYRFGTVPVDYSILKALHERAARQGEALAQYKFGRSIPMTANSLGSLRMTAQESLDWITKAAKQGLPEAQLELGRMYMEGGSLVVNRDPVTGAKWLKQAAEKEPEAMYLLAKAHFGGEGVLKSPAAAAALFRQAAEAGHARAQLELSLLLMSGNGVPADENEAVKWGRLADQPRPPGPSLGADEMFSLSPAPAALDLVQAHAWFNLASSRGYAAGHPAGISPATAMNVLEMDMSEADKRKAEELAAALFAELSPP